MTPILARASIGARPGGLISFVVSVRAAPASATILLAVPGAVPRPVAVFLEPAWFAASAALGAAPFAALGAFLSAIRPSVLAAGLTTVLIPILVSILRLTVAAASATLAPRRAFLRLRGPTPSGSPLASGAPVSRRQAKHVKHLALGDVGRGRVRRGRRRRQYLLFDLAEGRWIRRLLGRRRRL